MSKSRQNGAGEILIYLKGLANATVADHSQRYFKTGKGEYGHGDRFLGIRVPQVRKAVTRFRDTPFRDIEKLLKSEFHEVRLFALLSLVYRFNRGSDEEQGRIYDCYLRHTRYINNWDLVDSSAPYIVGQWLYGGDRDVLYELVQSASLWERRIAILASLYFIKQGDCGETLKLSKLLLNDEEDLIHKAVGWMLREVGKQDLALEERFLKAHYKKMPRTMLRYAIEKLDEGRRQGYLKGSV